MYPHAKSSCLECLTICGELAEVEFVWHIKKNASKQLPSAGSVQEAEIKVRRVSRGCEWGMRGGPTDSGFFGDVVYLGTKTNNCTLSYWHLGMGRPGSHEFTFLVYWHHLLFGVVIDGRIRQVFGPLACLLVNSPFLLLPLSFPLEIDFIRFMIFRRLLLRFLVFL